MEGQGEPDYVVNRVLAALVDGLLLFVVFLCLCSQFGVPPIKFMQSYTSEEQRNYWRLASFTLAAGFAYSFVLHWRFGSTLGKFLWGIRLVSADYAPLHWRQALAYASYVYALAACILVPGPLIALLLGQGSEVFSGLVLLVALFWVPSAHFTDRHPRHHVRLGIRVVEREP